MLMRAEKMRREVEMAISDGNSAWGAGPGEDDGGSGSTRQGRARAASLSSERTHEERLEPRRMRESGGRGGWGGGSDDLSEVQEYQRSAAESLARFRKAADDFVSPGRSLRQQGRERMEIGAWPESGRGEIRDRGMDRRREMEREEWAVDGERDWDRNRGMDRDQAQAWEEADAERHRGRGRDRDRESDSERARAGEQEDDVRRMRRDREREWQRRRVGERDEKSDEEQRGREWEKANARLQQDARERGVDEQRPGRKGQRGREDADCGVGGEANAALTRDAVPVNASVDEILYRAQKTQEAAVRALSPAIGRSHSPATGPRRVREGEREHEPGRGSMSPPSHSSLLRSLSPAYVSGRPFLGRAPSSDSEIARDEGDREGDAGPRNTSVGKREEQRGERRKFDRRGVRDEWEREREQDRTREWERERVREEGRHEQVMNNSVNMLKFFDSDARRDGDGDWGDRRAYKEPRADKRTDTSWDVAGRDRSAYSHTTDYQHAGMYAGPVGGGRRTEGYEESPPADQRLGYTPSAHGTEDMDGMGGRAIGRGQGLGADRNVEKREEFDEEATMAIRAAEGVWMLRASDLSI